MVLAGAVLPAQATGMVVPDAGFTACTVHAIVNLPCATQPQQLQTIRLSLVRSLMPMQCRTVTVRLRVGRYTLTPTRAAGALATLLFRHASRHAEPLQTCSPQSGW